MKVQDLIAALEKCPPDMEVTIWDAEEDDWVPVTCAVWEDGTSEVNILSGEENEQSKWKPACPDDGHEPEACPLGADGCAHTS